MPSLCRHSGISQPGMRCALPAWSISTSSSVTGWFSGAPSACQPGSSSVSARGSITAPDRMWAPGSEPFSSTTTDSAGSSCLSRMAVDSPAAPAPTTTTSYSMDSRGPCASIKAWGVFIVAVQRDFAVDSRVACYRERRL